MRRVLVTGAGQRIGAAIARGLAADGWHVVLHFNRSAASAEALAGELRAAGGCCDLLQADLSEKEQVLGLVGRAGRLDCLVNNAARFAYDDIRTATWESLHDHLLPNLAAPLLLSRGFAEQAAADSDRCIINLLDQKVGNLNPDFLSYTLSKVALSALTEMLAMALAPGVRVCGVAPGLTMISGKQTQASFERAWQATPLRRSSTPEEIASAVRFILATPSMTGQTIVLDGGESLRGRPRDVAFDPSV